MNLTEHEYLTQPANNQTYEQIGLKNIKQKHKGTCHLLKITVIWDSSHISSLDILYKWVIVRDLASEADIKALDFSISCDANPEFGETPIEFETTEHDTNAEIIYSGYANRLKADDEFENLGGNINFINMDF